MDCALVDRTGLGNVQGVTGLVELNAALIRKAEVRQNSVGIINADLLTVHLNYGSRTTGTAGKAGDLQSRLNKRNQVVIVRCKVRYGCRACVIENIACSTRLICGVQHKGICITKTTHDFENQELSGHSQRHVRIIRLGSGCNADGMVPQFICIEQDQADGFPAVGIQRIPDTAAFCTAASVEGNITVNGVARCTGCKISVGFNTIKRLISIRNVTIPGKVPTEILQVTVQRAAGSVPLILHRDLAIQRRGVVAIIREVKQHMFR